MATLPTAWADVLARADPEQYANASLMERLNSIFGSKKHDAVRGVVAWVRVQANRDEARAALAALLDIHADDKDAAQGSICALCDLAEVFDERP